MQDRDNGHEALNVDFQIADAGKRKNMRGKATGDAAIVIDEAWATTEGREFRPVVPLNLGKQCITFTVLGQPIKLMGTLRDILAFHDKDMKLSKTAWKASGIVRLQDPAEDSQVEEGQEEAKDEKIL